MKIMAVTNRKICNRPLNEQIERILSLEKRPDYIMLREKDLQPEEYLKLYEDINKLCAGLKEKLILHNFYEYAGIVKIPAYAVHVSFNEFAENTDKVLEAAKHTQSRKAGVSVHSLEEAVQSQKLGAGYVTAGHIFETDCKKGLKPRGTEFLTEIVHNINIPVFAIGGINEYNIELVKECGSYGACLMSGFMSL